MAFEKYQELGMNRLEQPPYSPYLAPSNFFLWGYLKKLLEGQMFNDEKELFEKIKELLNEISKSVLKSVFDEWIHRLFIVIERDDNFVY